MEKKKPAYEGGNREGVIELEITVRSDAKEIADLVLALQGQRNKECSPIKIIQEYARKDIDDTEPKELLSS